ASSKSTPSKPAYPASFSRSVNVRSLPPSFLVIIPNLHDSKIRLPTGGSMMGVVSAAEKGELETAASPATAVPAVRNERRLISERMSDINRSPSRISWIANHHRSAELFEPDRRQESTIPVTRCSVVLGEFGFHPRDTAKKRKNVLCSLR